MRAAMRLFHGVPIVATIVLSGCLATSLPMGFPGITQLELRAIQTRTYSGQDARTVLKVVLNVLQDDGFVVHYGSTDLGLLDASKTITELHVASFSFPVSVILLGSAPTTTAGVARIRATANVSEFGDRVKVRINFEHKLTVRGTVVQVAPVTEATPYQEFFAKLDKGLFIQREGL